LGTFNSFTLFLFSFKVIRTDCDLLYQRLTYSLIPPCGTASIWANASHNSDVMTTARAFNSSADVGDFLGGGGKGRNFTSAIGGSSNWCGAPARFLIAEPVMYTGYRAN
jgi:hypothetical protein